MYDHKLVLRSYKDGSRSYHSRVDTATHTIKLHEAWANSRPDVTSAVYTKIRAGELDNVSIVQSDLSKSESLNVRSVYEARDERAGIVVIKARQK